LKRTYEIKSVPIWPCTKVTFIALLLLGIIIAVIYSIIFSGLSFLAGAFDEAYFGDDFAVIQRLGLVMIPILAFSYAIFGTIGVIIWVLIYNLIAAIIGGVELTFVEKGGRPEGPVSSGPPEVRGAPGSTGAGTGDGGIAGKPVDGF